VLFAFFSDVDITSRIILFIPILLELFVFTLGVTFFLSAAYVRFRDISYLWEVALQILFYATPILYPLSIVPEVYRTLIMLNPLAQIIQDAKYAVTYEGTLQLYDVVQNWMLLIFPFALIGASVLIATLFFRKESKYFAENI
jgi:ABC-2 type transport system permease protein